MTQPWSMYDLSKRSRAAKNSLMVMPLGWLCFMLSIMLGDVVFDIYHKDSLKNVTRQKANNIRPPKLWNNSLRCHDSKNWNIWVSSSKNHTCSNQRTYNSYKRRWDCFKFTIGMYVSSMQSEEAYTRMFVHIKHASLTGSPTPISFRCLVTVNVLWLFLTLPGLVCSVWLWYFLVILT